MLRYKRVNTGALANGVETIVEILSCPIGKAYKIVTIAGYYVASLYLRVYRDAEQIVDCSSTDMTAQAPLLPMNLPLATGQVCKAGYYNNTGGAIAAKEITIGYEDAG